MKTDTRPLLLTSFSVFAFLLLSSPLISTVLAGLRLYLLFSAPLIATGVSSLAYFYFLRRYNTKLVRFWLCLFCNLSIPLALLMIRWIQIRMDGAAQNILDATVGTSLEGLLTIARDQFHMAVLGALAAPFALYGVFVCMTFEKAPVVRVLPLYIYELFGILLGFGVSALALDFVSMDLLLTLVFISSWVACIQPDSKLVTVGSIALALCALTVWFVPRFFEPQRDIHWSARDFHHQHQVTELDHRWNTYSSVQLLHIQKMNGKFKTVVSIGDGTGHATVPMIEPPSAAPAPPPHPAAILGAFNPQSALVLFAGAGVDLIALKKVAPSAQLIGVELNPAIIQTGLDTPGGALKKFLDENRRSVKLVAAEARSYIERQKDQFDAILFSWSGATVAHHSGAVVHTTKYIFTKEALRKSLSSLKPNGHLFIFGASKVNLLLMFEEIFREDQRGAIASSVAVLKPINDVSKLPLGSWDNQILVIKNGTFQSEDIDRLNLAAQKSEYQVALPANTAGDPLIDPLNQIIQSENPDKTLQSLRDTTGLHFNRFVDDRPFVYNTETPQNILTVSYWAQAVKSFWQNPLSLDRKDLVVAIAVLLLILFVGQGTASPGSPLSIAILFTASIVGFISTAMTMLFTYKGLLFLGNPTMAIVVVQSASLLGAMSGTLIHHRYSKFSTPTIVMILIQGFVCTGIWEWLSNGSHKSFFFQSMGFIAILLFTLSPAISTGFVFGFLLQNSRAKENGSTTLIYSSNVFGGAFAALFIPLIVENQGFHAATTSLMVPSFVLMILTLVIRKRSLRDF